MSIDETIRSIVRQELEPLLASAPRARLAYSVAELAAALGISDRQLYKHIDQRDLTPKFSGEEDDHSRRRG